MAIRENPSLAEGTYGKPVTVYSIALEYNRAPASDDITQLGRLWVDKSTGKSYILSDVSGSPLSATWREIADATPDGTDGELLIGATGADAAWANITSSGGTLVITNGANTINMEVSGATTSSFPTDAGTALPLLGATNIAGGTNIGTTGVGNSVTVNLDASPSVAGSLTAATSVTAGDSLIMSSGTCTITADDNTADVIYLHADGGVSEKIRLHADQGTAVDSVELASDVGGITIDSGLASADAINIVASDAAGGIDVDYGTAGMAVTGANGAYTLATGTGAISLGADAAAKVITLGNATGATSVTVDCGTGGASFGASASAHATTIGSTNTTASTVIQSGTGDVTITSTDAILADAAGVLELNSSGGVISIANDAVNQNVNISTAGNRTTTIGATGGTAGLVLNAGSGNITTASDGTIDIDSTGAVSVNSTGGALNVGNDADAQAVNISTGAANRTLTAGSTNTTSTTTIQSGSGGIALNSTLGSTAITATEDAADAIYLHANGGTSETIRLHADQGTGVASIGLESDVGGITMDSGLASADAINIVASDAAGGIDIDAGTNGIDVLATGGSVTVSATEDAANAIYLHANGGVSETVKIHSDQGTGVASVEVASDVGGVTISSGLASADAININASNAAGGIDVDCGTNGFALDATGGSVTVTATEDAADAIYLHTNGGTSETLRLHSDQGTGVASVGLISDVGGITLDAGLAAANSIIIDASDAAGGIDVDYGTGGMTVTGGNGAFTVATGTGAVSLGADAAAKTCTLGSTTGASATVVQSGSGNTSITSTGTVDVDATGAVSINSTGGALNVGSDADAQAVNICTGAAARDLTLGSTNTTSSTTVQAGTGGVDISAAGIVTMTPSTATNAGTSVTINANVGVATYTGQTTAAAASITLTVTNSVCTTGSAILASVSTLGSNDAQLTVNRIKPAAGSFTVQCTNDGAAAVNGNIILTFWIIAA